MSDLYSYLSNTDPSVLEQMHRDWKADPSSVDISWSRFFEGFEFALKNYGDQSSTVIESKEMNVMNLIHGYRQRGHLFTKTNPVRQRRTYSPTLDIQNFGLTENDLDVVFHSGNEIGIGPSTLRTIINHLDQTYCQSIGAEFRYIREPEMLQWLQQKMESSRNTPVFSIDKKKRILEKLNQAVVFETFLHTKFVGQKRFSLEGLETLIPALDALIEKGSELGVEEFVLGMAHRGRLNVLANTLNKSYEQIFKEFESGYADSIFDGDVKYHLGFSSDHTTSSGNLVHLSLAANPSHLEAVNPVVEGLSKAKLNESHKNDLDKLTPVLIHGDASIAGQGIVYEVIQMSLLDGYKTGGTVHIVTNNQIGFTTNYIDARSSTYCTDVAKVTLSPVFHINGDDAEAIVFAVELAMEFRQKFHRDVFIDILGYRKHGHNEGDEPKFTQPLLYKAIASHPDARTIYTSHLLETGEIEASLAKEMESHFKALLQEKLEESKNGNRIAPGSYLKNQWEGFRRAEDSDFNTSPNTGVSKDQLTTLGRKISTLPKEKKFITKIEKVFTDRLGMLDKNALDWGFAEALAYASLLQESYNVRISGQDVERGTFSHRHAVIKVEDSEEEYVPLKQIGDNQGQFEIYNSLLSEYGVLGFEYGYALASPKTLTIWEAQYGDFFNGAQIIIDQFIASGETKWAMFNGLVMMLPHGYEGSGPEHSSARLERFLEACAGNNIQVANCTTPANIFHLLRRQLHRPFRKPLVIFTPKALLRHPKCISSIEEFSQEGFKEVIDQGNGKSSDIKKVILCSGKVYYDLLAEKEKHNKKDVALIRLEQLYPFPSEQIKSLLSIYSKAKDLIWVQEEPENMGAWPFILRKSELDGIRCISRKESSSPATGSSKEHARQLEALMSQVFELKTEKQTLPA